MIAYGNRILAVLAALLVGVIFVMTVRTAGLHALAAKANCVNASADSGHCQAAQGE